MMQGKSAHLRVILSSSVKTFVEEPELCWRILQQAFNSVRPGMPQENSSRLRTAP